MKKNICKITSLALVLSLLFAIVTVFPQAEGEESTDNTYVFYNRGYEDGWDYDNGISKDYKQDLEVYLTSDKLSATHYNYYMNITPGSDKGGYLAVSLESDFEYSDRVYIEFDIKANEGNNIGGIVMVADKSEDVSLAHIASFSNGSLYLLGQSVGAAPQSFTTVGFIFDFGYADATDGAEADEYKVYAYLDGECVAERIYYSDGFGLSGVYFGAQENYTGYDREGDKYYLDNLKIYQGTESFAELEKDDYGTAVNSSAKRDYPLLGSGEGSGILTGSPKLDRLPAGDPSVAVHFNRYFSEGWNIHNGFKEPSVKENVFEIATDYANDINKGAGGLLNYFFRMVQKNTKNGFLRIDAKNTVPTHGKTYFEFDFKACENATIPGILEFITPGTPNTSTKGIMHLNNGMLTIFGEEVGKIGEEWCHIVFEIDSGEPLDNPDTEEIEGAGERYIDFTVWVGTVAEPVTYRLEINSAVTAFKGLTNIRIGRLGESYKEGHWYGMDNMQLYSAEKPAYIADDNYGTMVNTKLTKDYPINSGIETEVSLGEIVNSSLTMKVNSSNALLFGEKVNLFTDNSGKACGAPYKYGAEVMVPFKTILCYTDAPYEYNSDGLSCEFYVNGGYRSIAVGRDVVIVDGIEYRLSTAPQTKTVGNDKVIYIALDDVEMLFTGYYVTYDEVGFISISKYPSYVDRDTDEEFMRDVMKRFVYNKPSGETVYQLAKEKTNNFDHPYILVNQDRFDYLNETYYAVPGDEAYDEFLLKMIHTEVVRGENYFDKYANEDEDGFYAGLKLGQWRYHETEKIGAWYTDLKDGVNHSIAVGPYQDSNGYEPIGGRLNLLTDGDDCIAASIEGCAYAYQVTRDEKYARFVYDMCVAICQWQHWAPGHYLNAANATYFVAVGYDWCYDAFIELGLDPTPIEEGLYRNGTYTAWRSLNKLPTEFINIKGTESTAYWAHIGNWNPVCSRGVFAGALSLMGTGNNLTEIKYVMERTIHYLGQNGMNYFAFDGSYRESAGYWCASARTATDCCTMLLNACGDDFDLSKAPGLDITNYFGSHIESSNYERWNYHDDSEGSQVSQWYFAAAKLFDNPEFAVLRKHHIDAGKATRREDTFYYDREYLDAALESGDVDLALDFVMDSIDCVVSRESWERGSLYAGIMGGAASVAHGQYDSGNWIYENKGIRWFYDLGKDDYNLYGGSFAKGYYKYSAEGNNVIAITSETKGAEMPYGQTKDGAGEIIRAVTNEYGSATVIDQYSVYGGSSVVSYARRGMLVTNDRKTVVIQDEINFAFAQTAVWFAHFNSDIVSCELVDPKTAILTSKSNPDLTLRVSLLAADRGFKFEVWDAYTFALEATPDRDYSKNMNGVAEDNRDHIKRLVIVGQNTMLFEAAVVIELIDKNNPVELGYKMGWEGQRNQLQPMMTWVPGPDQRGNPGAVVEDTNEYRKTAQYTTLMKNGSYIMEFIADGNYFGKKREEFYIALADYEHALAKFGREHDNEEIITSLAMYDEAKAIYDKYHTSGANNTSQMNNIAKGLIGIKGND